MVRVRFAPSPTGYLHIGGARTALFNYLFAKQNNGKFIIRVEDTDRERSKKEYEDDIFACLKWLGINWEEGPDIGGDFGPYRQAERADLHVEAVNKMLATGAAYKDEDGTIRMPYNCTEVVVEDLICGNCVFTKEALGPDLVILRANGTATFHLANVVDDALMGITHVIRGQDHLVNTAKHILMFQALGYPVPKFAHIPLILGEDRAKLSKRNAEGGFVSVKDFKDKGYLPEALDNILMLLGWSHPDSKEQLGLEEVIDVFSLDRVNKTAAVFEPGKLNFLNGWWIRYLELDVLVEHVKPFCGEYQDIIANKGPDFLKNILESLRAELEFASDIKALLDTLFSITLPTNELPHGIDLDQAKKDFIFVASAWQDALNDNAPQGETYTEDEFAQLFSIVKKAAKDAPKKAIFQGLRFAITGKTSGPELKLLVPFISVESLKSRVEGVITLLSN